MRVALAAAILVLSGPTGQPAAAQQENVQPARVVGRVLDDETGKPIEAVEVRLVGEEMNVGRLSDGWGYFAFPRVPPGPYALVLSHVAYGTRAESLEIVGGDIFELVVRLRMQPIELEPLVVTVQVQHWQMSPRLWGFYQRADHGLGSYITRERIERRQPARISHAIAELPGVHLYGGGSPNSQRIVLSRYLRHDPGGRPGPCFPVLYLDGMRVPPPWSLDDVVFPHDIEGVEVYKGLAELPPEFASPDARCGVVAVWTRSFPSAGFGEPGPPLWQKLVIAGLIQGFVILSLIVML